VETAQLGLTVSAKDSREGTFVVVLTLQKGDAPGVVWTGDAAKLTVNVGKRRLGIDGTALSFAE
jgi:hypothetical protein